MWVNGRYQQPIKVFHNRPLLHRLRCAKISCTCWRECSSTAFYSVLIYKKGGRICKWVTFLTHSKKVLGLNLRWSGQEVAYSPCVYVYFLSPNTSGQKPCKCVYTFVYALSCWTGILVPCESYQPRTWSWKNGRKQTVWNVSKQTIFV